MSQAQLENKVAGYLRDSLALEHWQKPITAEQLQAEMDRMARNTKQSEVLRELFEALGNDPAVIAECLARPILAERLIAGFSAQDQTGQVESPQSNALLAMSVVTMFGQVVYTLPEIADACTDDTWMATTIANAPVARYRHTAVWTGSEMIVWGGLTGTISFENETNTGGRYNPSTNTWIATSITNAPTARSGHTAVWTGSEMIVWGGFEHVATSNTGGRYDPGTNTWTATSTTNAPPARDGHTAVWTGSEMIVWGGYTDINVPLITGGRYNPSTNSWIATGTTNAPPARYYHTAVWTGSEMIVWGGYVSIPGRPPATNTGGKYNPGTNSWRATSRFNTPFSQGSHTAVWTGSEMIIYGGSVSPGGRYQPTADSWRATSITNAPTGGHHTAVWTGSEMIVWGGSSGIPVNTGRRYCAQPPPPPLTVIQPNGGEVWTAGSVHQIKWEGNLSHSDHLIIQYSRDGGASWFRIAQDVPAFTFGYWWQVDNFPTTQGRMKILLQENLSITDQSDANFTVRRP